VRRRLEPDSCIPKATIGAFDQWCLRHILRNPYTAHVSKVEVWARIGQLPITTVIKQRRLRLFGHVARADLAEDLSGALKVSLDLPANWRRPRNRPRQTWQRAINDDISHLHLGLHSAYRQAQPWLRIVETTLYSRSRRATWRRWSLNVLRFIDNSKPKRQRRALKSRETVRKSAKHAVAVL